MIKHRELTSFGDCHTARDRQSQDLNESQFDGNADALNHSLFCPVLGDTEGRAGAVGIETSQPSPCFCAWSRPDRGTG